MRILVVDDDAEIRDMLRRLLEADDYQVEAVSTAPDALAAVVREEPDLVLLDLIMPKLNGFEVLRALKQDTPTARIPVIVLSNLGRDRDLQQAMEQGAAAYFVKADLSLQELVKRVEDTLGVSGA